MRVGLVIYGSLDTISGGYLYDRQLVNALREAGDQVDIISIPWRAYARHLTDNWSAYLRRRLEVGYDVLLQDELNHPSLAWMNGRLSRCAPIVSIVHHLRCSEVRPRWQNALYRCVERRYLCSVDGYIFNSRTTRVAVEALVGAGRPSVVAYPGGDRFGWPDLTGLPGPVRSSCSPLRLLFVGNLIPRKGLHVLLAAVAQLPDVDWRLTIVGQPVDVPYARRLRRLVDELPAGRVNWRGGLDDAALAAEMGAADALVVPSSYEGFGIVYLEGMGFGLPAIATTGGAAAEIITDGVDGFLIPPDDPAALTARLAALTDSALLAAMSAAARARFARHPTWEQTAAATRAFLVEMAARRSQMDADGRLPLTD